MFSCHAEPKRAGHHLCVFSCASAARRCVWTSSHRTSSCRRKVALPNASAGVLAGATFSRTPSHSPRCGRCAASFSPCWTLWQTQKEVRFNSTRVWELLRAQAWSSYLPPDSLQLGQVHATLRSLLPSWPSWSSSSPSLPGRWDRSLAFRVESALSQSPESGSSFIRISEKGCMKDVSEQLPQQLMFHLIDWKYF